MFNYSYLSVFILFLACTYDEPDLCSDQDPSFAECVIPIIQDNCVSCHSYGGSAGFLDLSSYESIRNSVIDGNLIDRINSTENPMPPSGKMSELTISIIKKWEENGAPNN